ncbi:hypothetical protein ABW19_dt0205295 [Dactylella cylindrospora]|nr:hypothetical protein ABW19_dt0205295 [Dactylella cylindrospora]
MRWLTYIAIGAFSASASPLPPQSKPQTDLETRALLPPYSVPNGQISILRSSGITTKRATFLYGPGIGGGPSSPSGPLGATYIAIDSAVSDSELAAQVVVDTADTTVATAKYILEYNGLKTLDDYTLLYDGTWTGSTTQTGVDPGMLPNYTQDLLFSMERLSFNPYDVRRLVPGQDGLPFIVEDTTIISVAGK